MAQDDSRSWLPKDYADQLSLACRILRFAYHSQASDLQRAVASAQEELEQRTALVKSQEEDLRDLQEEVERLQAEVQIAEAQKALLKRTAQTLMDEITDLESFRGKVLEVVDVKPDTPRRSINDLRLTSRNSLDSESSVSRRHGKLRELFEALRSKLPDASFSACIAEIKGYSKGEKPKSEALARLRHILRDDLGIYTAIAAVL